MLVLTRKINETIQIGENVFIKVVEIRGNRVKLGIQAPPSVEVLRGEAVDQREPRIVSLEDYVESRNLAPAA